MKQFLYKCFIALLVALLAAAAFVPVAASAQGTLPPKGYCEREGEVQGDLTWKAMCLNGIWAVATANADGSLYAPIAEAVANPTPLPQGAPTTLNGLLLPTTATSAVVRQDGLLGYYFFGGTTAAQVIGWDSYILIRNGEAYLFEKAVQGLRLLAPIADFALKYGTPLNVVAVIYDATTAVVQWSYIARPAIVHPAAIAAPPAPTLVVPTLVMYQEIAGANGNYFLYTQGGKCWMEKKVYWRDGLGELQSVLFKVEQDCRSDPASNKAGLLTKMFLKIGEWAKTGAAFATTAAPVLDEIMDLITKAYKGQI